MAHPMQRYGLPRREKMLLYREADLLGRDAEIDNSDLVFSIMVEVQPVRALDWCVEEKCGNPDWPERGHEAYPSDSGRGWMTMGCRGEGHKVVKVLLVEVDDG